MIEYRKLNRLKMVLKDKGRTGIWLAGKLGRHPNTVSKWASNEQQPDLKTFFEISVLLECDISELMINTQTLLKMQGKKR